MLTYRQSLSKILNDIVLVYKNFFHWNLSKIVLFSYAILASIFLSLPFLAIIIFCMYLIAPSLKEITMNNQELLVEALLSHIPAILIILLSGVIILTILVFFFSYFYYLLTHVYHGYLEGKKLGYFENHFFSWKHIWKYCGVIGWTGLYLLIPIFGFFILFVVVGIASIWVEAESVVSYILSGIGILGIIATICGFLYYLIRLVFATYALVETKDMSLNAKTYTDESFSLTKNNFWKTLGLLAPFIIGFVIISQIILSIQENSNSAISVLLGIVSFLCLDGLIYMIYYSVYHILKNNR